MVTMTAPQPRPTLGQLISQRRRALKLRQEDVGQRVGLSRDGVAKIEQGKTKAPPPETIRRLASVLSLPLSDLTDAIGYRTNPVEDLAEYEALSGRFAELMVEVEDVMRRMRRFMPGGHDSSSDPAGTT